jgi:hypothetical protein
MTIKGHYQIKNRNTNEIWVPSFGAFFEANSASTAFKITDYGFLTETEAENEKKRAEDRTGEECVVNFVMES